ncbi:zinc finger CCCH domain-containing protein 19-like isoform X2 [Solanum tuberosum]|nr:PREDICTED: zinc finger CCCH domain-containing protein 19-like isoform X2 [Solanum tuberosum]
MAENSGRRIFNKNEIAEDWCFQCKDGGELMICDNGGCLKAYHPKCAGVEDSVLTSDEPWICGRHTCLICKGKSYYHCYCCIRAACSSCIGLIDFVHLKGRNGLCNNCLKLALLVEEDKNIDSDGEKVDFRDRETQEGLFREYYEIVKEKEGIDKNKLLAGKALLDKEKICQISSYSDKRCEKQDEQLSLDNEDFNDGEPQKKKLKMKRCTQQKTKTQSKVIGSLEQNKISSIWYSTAPQSQFAALIPENIKLVYLKRSLVMELIKQPESIKTKIIGSFVRVKLDPRDSEQHNSHQLMQITGVFSGIKLGSSDTCNSESLIEVSNMATDVSLTMLSDAEISEEDCDVLRKNVKAGLQKKPTIVELEQRAKILHEDITKHRIAQELELLQKLIDRANEKGRRQELFQHLEKRKLLQQASYLSFVLQNIPQVTPEKIELESLDRNDNHMHRGMAEDERNGNKMHQCEDETTTPTKKNIPGVIPEKVGLEPLAENEDENLSSDNFSDGGPQKKRAEKKICTQQKTKMQRSDTSQKKEFVGWGSKSLIDFLQLIGHDTREKLSPYDVTSMVSKYVNENNLIHPVERRKILCDVQLEAILGKKVVNKDKIFSLLISHFVENEERLQKDELDHDLEDNDTEMLVASKTEKKVEQNKRSSISYSTAAQSQFAALIPENIKLVYLKRSLLLEMIKKPESFETKIIGSFVRVKLDPRDFELRNSHQLVQITGIKHGSSDNCCCKSLIQVSNITENVCLNTLSDDEFSNEECDEFRKKVKAGIFRKLTVVELDQKAKILHEDITNHRIARELELALQNIPRVIPEEVELESLDGDDNQMHLCSDEATLQREIILE